MTEQANLLIVTVTKVEAKAVLDIFSKAADKAWIRRGGGSKTYYELGIHGGVPVFMVQSEMGTATPGGALLTVRQAIQDLHPQAIIMCGIAFGLRPDKQKLGDILIVKQLQYYEPQKVDIQQGQIQRGDRSTSSERLLDRFRSGDIDWQGAKTHFGLVLSGEKLVNDSTFRDLLLKTEPEAIGGEMEGAGLYAAARDAKVDWILVKAICDWADGNKQDKAQPRAARNAAKFVLHVLQTSWYIPEAVISLRPLPNATVEIPRGPVKDIKFYIERRADTLLKKYIIKAGTTITIKGPRQTGKTSLLARGIDCCRQVGTNIIYIDFQGIDTNRLVSSEIFLRELAELFAREVKLDGQEVEKRWRGGLGPKKKLTYLLEEYILPQVNTVLLALDEADRLLRTDFCRDFFSLIRSWHNLRAVNNQWDKLNILLAISTEPYLLIDDINQSPFNIGYTLSLEDFDESQVREMNRRHGSILTEEKQIFDLIRLLAGHPYLTRQAFYTLTEEKLAWSDLIKMAPDKQGPFGDHLDHLEGLFYEGKISKKIFQQIIRANNDLIISGFPWESSDLKNSEKQFTTRNVNFKNIRTLLNEGFTYEELRRLCYDEPNFRPVYDQLAQGTGKDSLIDKLIEYAERKEFIETLLVITQKHNPIKYAKHQPYHVVTNNPTIPNSAHEKINDDLALQDLLRAGLIKKQGQKYVCRCELYTLYFKDKL